MLARGYLRKVADRIDPRDLALRSRIGRRTGLLASMAPAPRQVEMFPGWSFGFGEASADRPTRRRAMLWKAYAERGLEESLIINWYEDLRVWIHVPNDLSWALFVDGCFEPNQFAFLRSILRPGMVFIDVGANEGLYSLYASCRVGDRGRVLALEPSAREFERLDANIRLNKIQNVVALKTAASRTNGTARLRIAESQHAGHNTLGSFVHHTALLREEEVPVVTLDTVTAEHGISRVDVIKIDVEGAEYAVLEGARSIIARDHPALLVEVMDVALRSQGSSEPAFLDLLRGWGYSLHVFDPLTGRPVCAERPDERDPNMVAIHPAGRPENWSQEISR